VKATEIVIENLRAGIPITASTGAHHVVLEGYRDDTPDPLFCVNHGHGDQIEEWGFLFQGYTIEQDSEPVPSEWIGYQNQFFTGRDGILGNNDDLLIHRIQKLYSYCQPTCYVYVDPAYNGDEGPSDGCLKTPFTSFSKGYNSVPDDGHLWLKAGSYDIAPITLNKPMTIHAFQGDGTVVLPKSKIVETPFIDFIKSFFDNYPHLFLLLQRLFGLQ
jgi:hypothetical protein